MTSPDGARRRAANGGFELAAFTDPERLDPGWRSPEQVAAWLLSAEEHERLAGADRLRGQTADERRFLHRRALALARLGTAGTVEEALAAVAEFGAPADPGTVARVLAARRLPWLAEFVARWTEMAPFDARPTVDELVGLDAVPRPEGARYAAAMTTGLPESCPAARIRARLLTRPDHVTADVRALLTAPGAGTRLHRLDYAHRRRLDENTWTVQLATLAEEGVLGRTALVQLCLDVLDADGPAAPEGEATTAAETWFAGLLQRLEPTPAELEPQVPRLRRLLAANNPRLVELAQRSLLRLARAGKLPGRDVLADSRNVLGRPDRRLVLGHLRLLTELVRSGPGIAPAAVRVVAPALDHPDPDVQIEVLRFVAAYGAPATLAALDRELDLAHRSPALRSAATALRPAPGPPKPPSLERCVARVAAVPIDVRRRFGLDLALAAVQAGRFPHIAPVPAGVGTALDPAGDAEPGEVAELLARAMQTDADPVLVQQVLGAVVRSAGRPLAARAAAWEPHRDAARAVRAAVPFQHRGQPRLLLAELGDRWGAGRVLPDGEPPLPTHAGDRRSLRRLTDVLAEQVAECGRLVARAAAGGAASRRGLLAEPTHASGAVDPDVLLERLSQPGRPPGDTPLDVELAALRLPRGLPREFWAEAARRDPAVTRELQARYAAQTEPPLRAAVGVPAHRLGFRLGEGPRRAALASARPGLRAAGIWWALTDLDDVFAARPHRWGPDGAATSDAIVPHWPVIAPWHPELVAAHLLTPLAMAQQPGGIAAPGAAAAIGAPTGGPLGPIAHLALVQALQGVRAPTRLAAAGSWRAAVLDGRLDPGPTVAAMLLLQGGGLLRPARIVGALRPVVADPVVGFVTLQVLTAAVAPLYAERTPQVHLLLALAEQLAARFGADPALEEVRRAADPRRPSGRHRPGLPPHGPERRPAALAALDRALLRFEPNG